MNSQFKTVGMTQSKSSNFNEYMNNSSNIDIQIKNFEKNHKTISEQKTLENSHINSRQNINDNS